MSAPASEVAQVEVEHGVGLREHEQVVVAGQVVDVVAEAIAAEVRPPTAAASGSRCRSPRRARGSARGRVRRSDGRRRGGCGRRSCDAFQRGGFGARRVCCVVGLRFGSVVRSMPSQTVTVRPSVPAGGARSTDVGTVEAGQVEPVADLVVVEAEAAVGLRVTQEFVAVRGEVDDEQPPAGRDESRRFEDRPTPDRRGSGAPGGSRRGRSSRRRAAGCTRRPAAVRTRCTPLRSRLARATDSIEWLASTPTARTARGPSSWRMRPVPVPRSTSRPMSPSPITSPIVASTAASAACSERSSSQIGAICSKYSRALSAAALLHARQPARGRRRASDRCRRTGRARRRAARPSARRRRAGRRPTCLLGAWRRGRHRRAA